MWEENSKFHESKVSKFSENFYCINVSLYSFRCAEVSEALASLITLTKGSDQHKELFSARTKVDFADYEKIKSWFKEHNPFESGSQLISLDSGLVDEKDIVTCDKSEELGALIQKDLDGKTFAKVSFKKKNQICTLQRLYSAIKVGSDSVTIDSLTLFLRLVVVIERKPEDEITEYFKYELSPYPMSLFKDGIMRSAQKAKLKSFLLENIPTVDKTRTKSIADGGALLWCCDWRRNEPFDAIFKKYVNFLVYLQIDIVVFDGYEISTKDTTHHKRQGKTAHTVEIMEGNPCPADRTTFLSNYKNKSSFVKWLSEKLGEAGLMVVQCPSDADTTIVKVAIDDEEDVMVYSDDTDVLCLLLHHFDIDSNKDIFLSNMTRSKSNQARECVSIRKVIQGMDTNDLKYLLFAHAFTGCDTTSAIHRFGKLSIFKKFHNHQLMQIADMFYSDIRSPDEIGNATIHFFEHVNSSPKEDLHIIRKKKYEAMVMSNRSNLDPSSLPPSPRAAFFHGLRVFHQLKVWKSLSNNDIEPCKWGWEMKDDCFYPIMTDQEPGPQNLLKVVRCSCKNSCNNRCSCIKAGLKCSSFCKWCLENNCSNVVDEISDDDNEELPIDDDRHFLDAFLD